MKPLQLLSIRSTRQTRMRASVLACSALLALGLAGAAPAAEPAVPAPVWRTDATAGITQSLDLIGLVPGGQATAVKLTGATPTQYFDFGVRADEIVSSAVLELDFTASPSLLPSTSQINVFLNGELQSSQALTKDTIGKPSHISVPLNAKAMKSRNQVAIEFVGHYQIVCENESNKALWLDIAPTSRLTLAKQNLRLSNDLAQLPLPFVDAATNEATVLPFVFAGNPGREEKTAAAIMAGHTAAIAGWRGASFPVYFSEIPGSGHFVAFATNDKRPAFLAELPPFEGPELFMLDAPGSLHEKMLVIAGKTDADLITAAQALAASGQMLIGPHHRVKVDFKPAEPAAPYTSRNWVNTDNAVPLRELMEYPEQLTARGTSLPALHLTMRLAPDIYLTSASEVNVNLLYRFTKPAAGQAAQLRTLVNGALADSENLSEEASRGAKNLTLPLTEGPAVAVGGPRAGLAAVNDISFEARYQAVANEGSPDNCRAATLPAHQIQIDPSSMIEFSGMYHYAHLPEIALFAQGGFPFSKYADLSQTAAVIADNAPASMLTTLFNAIGRIGAATGAAPVHVTVASAADAALLKNKDLLIVGSIPETVLDISADSAKALTQALGDWFKKPVAAKAEATKANAGGSQAQREPQEFLTTSFAAITSAKSPVDSDRTAVALLSEGAAGAHVLNTRIANPGDLAQAAGGTVFLGEDSLTGFAPLSTYTVGDMPWFRRVWLSLADRPFILVLCALAAALAAGAGIFFYMRRWIRRRS